MKLIYIVVACIFLVAASGLLVLTKDVIISEDAFFGVWRTRSIIGATLLASISVALLCVVISKKALRVFLIGVFQILLVLFLMETLGQVGLVNYDSLIGRNQIKTNLLGSKAVPFLYESGVTYQDIATGMGIDHPPIPFEYKTDRRGFRNPDDPEMGDIYLLGDSIVVGATVSFDETVTGFLGKDSNLDFLNVALIGIGVQEQHKIFMKTNLPLKNKFVLQFVFEGNDLLDSRFFNTGNDLQISSSDWKQSLLRKSFINQSVIFLQRLSLKLNSTVENKRSQCVIENTAYEFLWLSNSFSELTEEFGSIFDAIKDFSNYVHKRGGSYSMVFVPSKFRVLHEYCDWSGDQILNPAQQVGPFRETITQWSHKEGINLIDLTQALSDSTRSGAVPWYWGDTHWNEIGHKVAASTIERSEYFLEWRSGVR